MNETALLAEKLSKDTFEVSNFIDIDIFPIFVSMQECIEALVRKNKENEARIKHYEELVQKRDLTISQLQKRIQYPTTKSPTSSTSRSSDGNSPRAKTQSNGSSSLENHSPRSKYSIALESPRKSISEQQKVRVQDLNILRNQLNNEKNMRIKVEQEKQKLQQIVREHQQTISKLRSSNLATEKKLKTIERKNFEQQSQFPKTRALTKTLDQKTTSVLVRH
jgi:hypothetical protein